MASTSSASFEYLEQLQPAVKGRLYRQPATALAVFRRMLPDLAKTFVMAMLYMPVPLPLSDLDLMIRPSGRSEKEKALGLLHSLYIATASRATKDDPQGLSLTANFAASLRTALTGGTGQQPFGVPSTTSAGNDVDIHFLDSYARSQWEGILHYVVNSYAVSSSSSTYPDEFVQHLLSLGQLVDSNTARQEGLGITQAGFTFLLQESNAQVWAILLIWLENASEFEMDESEILSFLFTLGSLELGLTYSTATLTPSQLTMLSHLASLGLVHLPPFETQHPQTFNPTRLATTLTSSAPALRTPSSALATATNTPDSSKKGFIIIETNYRLYAYTSSPLQIAVLSLFTRLSTRFPNMVTGRLTRDSIRTAIASGITSDQIITYLGAHAHPQMRKHLPILPPTVVDQIRLWQIENERMKATPGYLFKDFATAADYDVTVRHAETIGVLVWRSDASRRFFASRHEGLREFIRARKIK